MARPRERRLARLEQMLVPRTARPPLVLIMQQGESQEETVKRLLGNAGLPPREPHEVPHIFIHPVWAPPHPDAPVDDQPEHLESEGDEGDHGS